jgi:uracil-DNA glycosylase
VVRCFPGKTTSGGDRVPNEAERSRWRGFLAREVAILEPRLIVPVGRLAISEVLGADAGAAPLAEVVGRSLRVTWHGAPVDVIPLPHPSGASTWFKLEPGRTLLERALRLLARHREVVHALGASRRSRDQLRGPPRATSALAASARERRSAMALR